MPKLEQFELTIKTGSGGRADTPTYSINGFPVDFDSCEGGTGSGESLCAKGAPQSFPHALLLIGPETGTWDIESIEATYECAGSDPYTVYLGAITLDEETSLNIWHEPPAPTFDV